MPAEATTGRASTRATAASTATSGFPCLARGRGLLLEVDLLEVPAHAQPQQDDGDRERDEHHEPEPALLDVGRVRRAVGEEEDRDPEGVHASIVATRSRTPANRSSSGISESTRLRASS